MAHFESSTNTLFLIKLIRQPFQIENGNRQLNRELRLSRTLDKNIVIGFVYVVCGESVGVDTSPCPKERLDAQVLTCTIKRIRNISISDRRQSIQVLFTFAIFDRSAVHFTSDASCLRCQGFGTFAEAAMFVLASIRGYPRDVGMENTRTTRISY